MGALPRAADLPDSSQADGRAERLGKRQGGVATVRAAAGHNDLIVSSMPRLCSSGSISGRYGGRRFTAERLRNLGLLRNQGVGGLLLAGKWSS